MESLQRPAAQFSQLSAAEGLRIGLFGTARISWAAAHGVERVLDSYDAVINDPEVEAIYNPLPNSTHAPWNVAAIRAGKHVLTEKPFASNAREARQVLEVAERQGNPVVVFEGFHYVYHPIFSRFVDLAAGGAIGRLQQRPRRHGDAGSGAGGSAVVVVSGGRRADGSRLLLRACDQITRRGAGGRARSAVRLVNRRCWAPADRRMQQGGLSAPGWGAGDGPRQPRGTVGLLGDRDGHGRPAAAGQLHPPPRRRPADHHR